MEREMEKALKSLVSEGYKLKKQHSNPEWKKALEEAESVLIKRKKERKEGVVIFENWFVRTSNQ